MPGKKPTRKSSSKVKKSARKQRVKKLPSSKKRKKSEASLDREKLLDIVLDTAAMGIWEWWILESRVRWTGKVFEIFGMESESFAINFDTYLSFVHPEDKELFIYHVEQSLKSTTPYNLEYRIVLKDGTIRWIHALGSVACDKTGKAIKMTGTIQDVTSRKVIEIEREEWKRRFDLISTSAGLVIYDYDIASGEIEWSGNSLDVLGYKPEELGNIDRWTELIHPEDRAESLSALDKAKKQTEPYDFIYRFAKKNGDYCYMHDHGILLCDNNGKGYRMLGMMKDVTAAITSQEQLRESEQRFRTLQAASFSGLLIHDHGFIIDCNEGMCNMTGYSYDELVGSDGIVLISPDWRDFVLDKIKSRYEKTYDIEGLRRDGTRYPMEVRGRNITYNGREVRVTELRDITERKLTEQKIKEQHTKLLAVAEDLKRKNAQLEEFTQIVSHNLRSPVGNLLVLVGFLENATTETERREYITFLKEAASTTHTMLTELNDILKIKQNLNIEKQDLQFEVVLRQIKSMLSAKITELSAEITSDFSAAPTLHYPTIYLESILLNLIDNSLKYRVPGRPPKIHLTSSRNELGEITLEVRDNGLGIDLQRYGHHVFKLRKTFHLHPESRGIGLFMIKNQIETMGGEITISSRENEGSTFFITFNKHQTDAG